VQALGVARGALTGKGAADPAQRCF